MMLDLSAQSMEAISNLHGLLGIHHSSISQSLHPKGPQFAQQYNISERFRAVAAFGREICSLNTFFRSNHNILVWTIFYSTALASPMLSRLTLRVPTCSSSLVMPIYDLVWAFFLRFGLVGPGRTTAMARATSFLTMAIPKYTSLSWDMILMRMWLENHMALVREGMAPVTVGSCKLGLMDFLMLKLSTWNVAVVMTKWLLS